MTSHSYRPSNRYSNSYGTHPFYLETRYFTQDADGKRTLLTSENPSPDANYTAVSHGVYLRNPHGQDVLLRPDSITWRTIGGSIDLYFFPGPSQAEVTRSYQKVIGLPAFQQYWTLGFHQCRWGYTSWKELDDVVKGYTDFQIPLEAIWYVGHWLLAANSANGFEPGLILTT